jgi:hypothetical protein
MATTEPVCLFVVKVLIMAPPPRREKHMTAKFTKSIRLGLTPELLAMIRITAKTKKTSASALIRSAIEHELGMWPSRDWTPIEVMRVFREEDR